MGSRSIFQVLSLHIDISFHLFVCLLFTNSDKCTVFAANSTMLGSQCFQNPPSLSSDSHGAGTIQELGGLRTHITGPPDPKLAIILVSDVFGKDPSSISYLYIFILHLFMLLAVVSLCFALPSDPAMLFSYSYIHIQ